MRDAIAAFNDLDHGRAYFDIYVVGDSNHRIYYVACSVPRNSLCGLGTCRGIYGVHDCSRQCVILLSVCPDSIQ